MYQNIISLWEKQYKERIFSIDYEGLVNTPEVEIRKILRFLDLDWETSCINLTPNTRVVRTASQLQVRKKIYTDSSESWKNYSVHLDGYFDNL